MKLQIDRIDQHELTGFINRVKLIDSFVYMKINRWTNSFCSLSTTERCSKITHSKL